jgi:hypothetical protein
MGYHEDDLALLYCHIIVNAPSFFYVAPISLLVPTKKYRRVSVDCRKRCCCCRRHLGCA